MMISRGPIVATIDCPAQIQRFLGGAGACTSKQLINGFHLGLTWNCVEHVVVPCGSSIGAHTHDRTEEIYVILSGRGRMKIDGESVDVTAGDVVTTQIGASHAIAGSEPDGETFSSSRHFRRNVTRATASRAYSRTRPPTVTALPMTSPLPLPAPWHVLNVAVLAPGVVRTVVSGHDTETVLFIAAGAVSVDVDVDVAPLLQAGQCIFVPNGTTITFTTTSATPARLISVALRER